MAIGAAGVATSKHRRLKIVNQDTALDEWRTLYELANRIKEIAPWQWMVETNVFGVQNPETGELGFVSVMGHLGKHFALAVYLGDRALYHFRAIQDERPGWPPGSILDVLQLQVSFENREALSDRDLWLIKELGLKFRGRHAWPLFRSFRTGFHPWFLEPQEVRFLTCVLEQASDVVLRYRDNPALLTPSRDESYLVRVSRREADRLIWTDATLDVPPPEPESIFVEISPKQLSQAKRLPVGNARLEIDVFALLSAMIAEKPDERPQLPYIFLCLDSVTGMVLISDVMSPFPSVGAMRASVPGELLEQFTRWGKLPAEIRLVHADLYQVLQPLARELKIKLTLARELPTLESVKEFMLDRFQR